MYLSETFNSADTKYKPFLVLILLIFISFAQTHSLAAPSDSVEVVVKHQESGASSIYQINFALTKPIPPQAIIRITFSDEFDLSALLIAGSTTIKGGLEMKVEKQVVTMKRSGLGREIPANEKVDIKLAIVNNPKQPGDNYKIVVEVLDEHQTTIVKQEKLHKVLPATE